MTLIVGVNLSDRVHLAADTRVSIRKGDGSFEYRDDLLKLTQISPHVHVAVAGVAEFAKHLVIALKGSILASTNDIRMFRDEVLNVVGPAVDEWLKAHDYAQSECCLVFAGLGSAATKRVLMRNDRLIDMVGAAYRGELKRVELMLAALQDVRQVHLHSAVVQLLSQATGPRLKPQILQALARGAADSEGYVDVSVRDSHVFSLMIQPPTSPAFEDAEWGEILLYGSKGVRRDQIPVEAVSTLEFLRPDDLYGSATLLTAMVMATADEMKLQGVGGGVTCLVVSQYGTGLMPALVQIVEKESAEARHLSNVVVDPIGGLGIRTAEDRFIPLVPLAKWEASSAMRLSHIGRDGRS